jgi:hypothetical protein
MNTLIIKPLKGSSGQFCPDHQRLSGRVEGVETIEISSEGEVVFWNSFWVMLVYKKTP